MKKIWTIDCHSERRLSEIDDVEFHPSGKFWPDLNNLVLLLAAVPHPSFVNDTKIDSRFSCSCFRFDEFSLKILCNATKGSNLKSLKFSNCCLIENFVNYLTELTENGFVDALSIDWNPLPDSFSFVKLLHSESKLQELSLKACELNDQFFAEVCDRLQKNESLKTLDLYGNRINYLNPLAAVLHVNRTLQTLSLSSNSLKDSDLQPLVGVFGKIHMTSTEAEDYKKQEREKATSKYLGGDRLIGKTFTDELEFDEAQQEYFLIKNKVFRNLNLSLNCLESDHYLRLMLSQSLPGFKVVLSKNSLPDTVKSALFQAFSTNLVV